MQTSELKLKTLKSNTLLERARDYATQAAQLPPDDNERIRLEAEAARLLEDAKKLTNEAKSQVNKLSSSFGS